MVASPLFQINDECKLKWMRTFLWGDKNEFLNLVEIWSTKCLFSAEGSNFWRAKIALKEPNKQRRRFYRPEGRILENQCHGTYAKIHVNAQQDQNFKARGTCHSVTG